MRKYQLTALGNALVDIEFTVDEKFFDKAGIEKGVMTLIEKDQHEHLLHHLQKDHEIRKKACGGSAANTIVTAAHFGASTFYCCKVGNDDYGHFYAEDLSEAKVDSDINVKKDVGETGKCIVMVSEDADRTMNTYLGITGTFGSDQINEDAIANSEYLYIEGHLVYSPIAVKAILEAKEMARKHGTKIALTVSDPAVIKYVREHIEEVIGDDGIDLLFCNEDEATDYGHGDLDKGIAMFMEKTSHLVLTRGSRGASVFKANEETLDVEPFAVEAVDTTGAGDTFAGAYLYGITAGLDEATSARLANRTAAECVAHFGPRISPEKQDEIKQSLL